MIDLRRIRIGIEVNGGVNWYEDPNMNVTAAGTKYANPLQNDCTVTISGLSTQTRDYILTETSPFNSNRTPKRLIVEAGRQSTGVFRLFIGDIISSSPGSPPDVNLTIRAKTMNAQSGNVIAVEGGPSQKLSAIADRVAREIGVALDFIATDKNIANFSYTGAALKMVDLIQQAGRVRAYIDDEILIVKDYGRGDLGRMKILNQESGMVGIPKPTESGVDVQYVIDGESLLGGILRIDSRMFKAINGDYVVDQLKFEVSSHSDPFFYTATCSRPEQ